MRHVSKSFTPRGFQRGSMSMLVCAFLAAWAPAARGATFTVTTVDDAGAGSLRDAIDQANLAAGADQIDFQAGLTGTIILATTLPDITEEVTINGPGPRLISITGSNLRRCMIVNSSATIIGLRLANGFTDQGAGIRFDAANGTLTVNDCHFDQHLATGEGGAICILAGSFELERCTFTTDQSASEGGVIWYGQGGGTPTGSIINCTFVNNFASQLGGAVRQDDTTAYTTAITNCTFVVNNAGSGGGAISVAGGTMTLRNSLFTANGAGGNPGGHVGTVAGTTTSLGYNLFGHMDGANFAPDPTDKFGTPAAQLNTGILIAFPFNNGGLTDTLPPQNDSSILIDGGDPFGSPFADQRDFPRIGCAPDVGAFELQTPADADDDGVINCLDTCPNTPTCASVDQTGCPTDSDADGVFDGCDACPGTFAGDPVSSNGCSTADEDGDGVLNDADQCRGTPPCAIASVNAAGCPADADADGLFDGCDNCPGADDLTDTDADGIPDCLDACPAVGDTDGDGVQDCQDGCPADALKISPGACGCGNVDVDTDADGIPDCQDGCPADALKLDPGVCGCGVVDADVDGDGVADCIDGCPADALKLDPGVCGCGVVEVDADADGVLDCNDACAGTPACAVVDETGCEVDSDADGVADGCDQCSGTFAGDAVDANGCSTVDEDGDGVLNDSDACRGTPPCAIASVGADGCPADADGDGLFDGCDQCPGDDDLTDGDGDGIPDCLDACPNDGDSDGDGVQDCQDDCPNDALKREPGSCGCGASDADTTGNGIPDCIDPAPTPPPTRPGLQPFIALGPVLPGGISCGIGLAGPLLVVSAYLMLGGLRRRPRVRRQR